MGGIENLPFNTVRTLRSIPAVIKLLRFIFHIPNHSWPSNPELASYADAQVLQAASNIMANANVNAVQEIRHSGLRLESLSRRASISLRPTVSDPTGFPSL